MEQCCWKPQHKWRRSRLQEPCLRPRSVRNWSRWSEVVSRHRWVGGHFLSLHPPWGWTCRQSGKKKHRIRSLLKFCMCIRQQKGNYFFFSVQHLNERRGEERGSPCGGQVEWSVGKSEAILCKMAWQQLLPLPAHHSQVFGRLIESDLLHMFWGC